MTTGPCQPRAERTVTPLAVGEGHPSAHLRATQSPLGGRCQMTALWEMGKIGTWPFTLHLPFWMTAAVGRSLWGALARLYWNLQPSSLVSRWVLATELRTDQWMFQNMWDGSYSFFSASGLLTDHIPSPRVPDTGPNGRVPGRWIRFRVLGHRPRESNVRETGSLLNEGIIT